MPDEEFMTPKAVKALQAEIRADEYAARVRDFGEAGAADYETGRDEAYRMQAEALGLEPRQFQPIPSAEIDRAVADIERGWQRPYEQMLQEVADRGVSRTSEREPER